MHKVGILGSAVVGQTLARGFKTHGHDVRIGSRTPAKLADFSSSTGIAAATSADVAKWADLIVLAVHGRVSRGGARGRRRGQPGGKSRHRHDEPDQRSAAGRRSDSVLHRSEQLVARTPAVGVPQRAARQGVQQRRQHSYGEPCLPTGAADDVLLRQRRTGESRRRRDPAAIRLGAGRHGHCGRSPGDRAAMPTLVHPWISSEQLDARVCGVVVLKIR